MSVRLYRDWHCTPLNNPAVITWWLRFPLHHGYRRTNSFSSQGQKPDVIFNQVIIYQMPAIRIESRKMLEQRIGICQCFCELSTLMRPIVKKRVRLNPPGVLNHESSVLCFHQPVCSQKTARYTSACNTLCVTNRCSQWTTRWLLIPVWLLLPV